MWTTTKRRRSSYGEHLTLRMSGVVVKMDVDIRANGKMSINIRLNRLENLKK